MVVSNSAMARKGGSSLGKEYVGILIAAVLLIIVPLVFNEFRVSMIARGLIYAVVAMSFTFLAGYVGLLSLTQVAFFGLAGYTIAITTKFHFWSWGWGVVAAIVFTLLFAWVFGYISRNAGWLYFLMMGLAMVQIAYSIAMQATDLTGGHDGIQSIPPIRFGEFQIVSHGDTMTLWYYIVLVVFALVYLFFRLVTKSPFGIALQGVRDNPKRMSALGFNVPLLKHQAIVISAFIAAIGGVLWVYHYGGFAPNDVKLDKAVEILFICLLGGTLRMEGAIIGSVVYVLLDDIGRQLTGMYLTVLGAFFVLVIIFLPDGLISLPNRLRKRANGNGSGGAKPQVATTQTAAK